MQPDILIIGGGPAAMTAALYALRSGRSVKLLEKEKKILLYRFEFCGGEKYTLKRIGAELGISPETVRQIEKRALRKLKDNAPEMISYGAC